MSNKYKVIIFDLDNVLYDEKNYILATFKKVAELLDKKFNLKSKEVYNQLVKDFNKKTSLYPRLFNDLLKKYFGRCDQDLLNEILLAYSKVKPKIYLYPGAEKIISKLKASYQLVLLTNGRIDTQKNKVKILKIAPYFTNIIYARKFGAKHEKPSTLPYKKILKILNISANQAVAIGDNPYTDFKGPKKLGIKTVRVLTGEFKNIKINKKYQPDFTIKKLSDLIGLLNKN